MPLFMLIGRGLRIVHKVIASIDWACAELAARVCHSDEPVLVTSRCHGVKKYPLNNYRASPSLSADTRARPEVVAQAGNNFLGRTRPVTKPNPMPKTTQPYMKLNKAVVPRSQ